MFVQDIYETNRRVASGKWKLQNETVFMRFQVWYLQTPKQASLSPYVAMCAFTVQDNPNGLWNSMKLMHTKACDHLHHDHSLYRCAGKSHRNLEQSGKYIWLVLGNRLETSHHHLCTQHSTDSKVSTGHQAQIPAPRDNSVWTYSTEYLAQIPGTDMRSLSTLSLSHASRGQIILGFPCHLLLTWTSAIPSSTSTPFPWGYSCSPPFYHSFYPLAWALSSLHNVHNLNSGHIEKRERQTVNWPRKRSNLHFPWGL